MQSREKEKKRVSSFSDRERFARSLDRRKKWRDLVTFYDCGRRLRGDAYGLGERNGILINSLTSFRPRVHRFQFPNCGAVSSRFFAVAVMTPVTAYNAR